MFDEMGHSLPCHVSDCEANCGDSIQISLMPAWCNLEYVYCDAGTVSICWQTCNPALVHTLLLSRLKPYNVIFFLSPSNSQHSHPHNRTGQLKELTRRLQHLGMVAWDRYHGAQLGSHKANKMKFLSTCSKHNPSWANGPSGCTI